MTAKKEEPQEQVPEQEPVTEEQSAKNALLERVEKFRSRYSEVGTQVEAGGIAFCTVYVGNLPINVTSRANNPYDAMATLLNAVSVAKDSLNVTLEKAGVVHAAAPVITSSFGPPSANTETPSPFDPPATSAVPSAPVAPSGTAVPVDSGEQSFIAKKLEITPRAGGKAEMKFYSEGHRFPDLYSTMTLAYCASTLAPTGAWTEEHFKQAAEYDVNYLVKWKNSEKLNSKGKPYKDLISVESA